MHAYETARISSQFLDKLASQVLNHESLLLLGPRHIGKRYTLEQLRSRLLKCTDAVRLESFLNVNSADVGPRVVESIQWVETILERSAQPLVILAASHVDNLPYEGAEKFLSSVFRMQRDHGPRLAAIVTGELVLGKYLDRFCDPFTTCYTIRGYDLETFALIGRRYLTALGLPILDDRDRWRKLHHRIDGNIYLLRLLLWTVYERRAQDSAFDHPLDISQLPDQIDVEHPAWKYYLQLITQTIAREPGTWNRLETLLQEGSLPVESRRPDVFELIGLAEREGGELRLGNTIAHHLIREHYQPRRFADLHASAGNWARAFACYRKLSPEERIRLIRQTDLLDGDSAISDLRLSLYSVAARDGSAAVRRRLIQGCRLLLGFPEVSFWIHRDGIWKHDVCPESTDIRGEVTWYRRLLPQLGSTDFGAESVGEAARIGLNTAVAVPDQLTRKVIVYMIPQRRSDEAEAVIIGGPQPQPPLSNIRQQRTVELLQDFLTAYGRALITERERQRLDSREQYSRIINKALAAIGSEVRDVGPALEIAAKGLREMGYRRVLCCLLDPTQTRLEAVHEDSEDPDRKLLTRTRFTIEQHPREASAQITVVKQGRSLVTSNFQEDPVANQSVTREADLLGGAIVPIKSERNPDTTTTGPPTVIGTIFIERQDRRKPTPEEVADLEDFAARLAVTIENCERINLLQSALDQLREPVILLDGKKTVRYLNQNAARYLDNRAGWYEATEAFELPHDLRTIKPVIEQTWQDDVRLIRHIRNHSPGDFSNAALMTSQIKNWRNQRAGVLASIQDLSYAYQVFDVLDVLQTVNRYMPSGERTQTNHLEPLLTAVFIIFAKSLHHRWSVLYEFDEDKEELYRKYVYGLDNVLQKEEELIPWRDSSQIAPCLTVQRCRKAKVPVVFCYRPSCGDSTPETTKHGLEVIPVSEPGLGSLPLQLQRSAQQSQHEVYWIEFPLIAAERYIGKLSLSCNQTYDPERFEFLKVLCELLSSHLESALLFDNSRRLIEEEVHLFQRLIFHQLKTPIGELSHRYDEFSMLEHDEDMPSKLADELREALDNFGTTIDRIRTTCDNLDRLTSFFLDRNRTELKELIQSTANEVFGTNNQVLLFSKGSPSVCLNVDAGKLREAFRALMENSLKFKEGSLQLHVSIHLRGVNEVELTFWDNGPGIHYADLLDIFRDGFTKGREGSGFGLFYVKRVIEAHGGTIEPAVTKKQNGARFIIRLPLDATRDAVVRQLAPTSATRST